MISISSQWSNETIKSEWIEWTRLSEWKRECVCVCVCQSYCVFWCVWVGVGGCLMWSWPSISHQTNESHFCRSSNQSTNSSRSHSRKQLQHTNKRRNVMNSLSLKRIVFSHSFSLPLFVWIKMNEINERYIYNVLWSRTKIDILSY
jgi:hypothetical protein